MEITKLTGREIYDSRGIPTVECELYLDDEIIVRASAPSGTSKSPYEARELRDGGKRLEGMGVSKAIKKLEDVIAPALIGQEPDLVELDVEMVELDGTTDKSKLGANTMTAVSMAVAKAQAVSHGLELYELIAHFCEQKSVSIPFPLLNLVNGGAHTSGNFPVQEIMIMPAGMQTFREAMESSQQIFRAFAKLLEKKGIPFGYGLEGGYAFEATAVEDVLDMVMSAIASIKAESQVFLSLDIAAQQLYDSSSGTYRWFDKQKTSQELIAMYQSWVKTYPMYAIEDGLQVDDWDGWQEMTALLKDQVKIVGDDIFATNPHRISEAIERKVASAAIIKPNQIGTITETLQAINLCREGDLQPIISHRSGETEDTFIVDLAIGTNAGHIKAGGCRGGERIAKYNQLLRLEDTLLMSMLDE